MKAKLFQNKIYVKKSPIHGYGVFAKEDINAGEIVEECHTLFTKEDRYLHDYLFKGDDDHALPLGFGAIYNHADIPNATFDCTTEKGLIIFTALKKISAEEEILCYYGKYWFSSREIKTKKLPVWYQWHRSLFFRGLLVCALCLWGIHFVHQFVVNELVLGKAGQMTKSTAQ